MGEDAKDEDAQEESFAFGSAGNGTTGGTGKGIGLG